MKTIVVNVTQENISGAVVRDSHRCMIADAIQKQIKGAKYIMVDLQSIRFSNTDKSERYVYFTPLAAQRALIAFDQGKRDELKPFKFTLHSGTTRQIRSHAPGWKPTARKTKQTRKRKPTRYMPSRYREFGVRQLV